MTIKDSAILSFHWFFTLLAIKILGHYYLAVQVLLVDHLLQFRGDLVLLYFHHHLISSNVTVSL